MLLPFVDNFIFLFKYDFVNLELVSCYLISSSAKQIKSRHVLKIKACVVSYINNYFQRILFTNFDHVISKNNKFTVLLISWSIILNQRIWLFHICWDKQTTSFRHISGLTIGHRTVTCKIVYLFIKGWFNN